MPGRRLLAGAVAAVALLVAPAGAGAPGAAEAQAPRNPLASTLARLEGLGLAARERRLLQLARAEGGVVEWYTSLSAPISEAVEEAFEERYPDLEVNRYRASSETLAQRLLEEWRAGRAGADVVETNGTEMLHFQHRKTILVPYGKSPYRAAVPRYARFDTWTGSRVEKFIVAWNRDRLPAGGPPRTFEDLAGPRFRGRLSMEPTDIDWYAQLWTYLRSTQKWSAARIDRMFAGIARNSMVTNGHTTQATLLAAGQFAAVVSAHAVSVKNVIEDGAPLAYRPFVAPVIQRPQGVGIAYRLRHPAGALLFYDWLLSPAGQRTLRSHNAEPARRNMGDPEFRGAKVVFMNLRPIVSQWARWSRRYEAVIGLAGDR
jgi:iron(III) transport system substrate-binding protein